MTNNFADILDEALAAIKTEPVTAVLHRYPDHTQTLAPLLTAAEKLGKWQTAVHPTPSPGWQTVDRAHFLDQIEQLPPVPVSPNPLLRLKKWLTQTRPAFAKRNNHKERKPMNVLFARAVATALVLFGLGGGTVALANDSLPDTPLYPVKLMLEETRMAMADNPVKQANLQMSLAQVRLEEMTHLAQAGDLVNEPLVARLEAHLQNALQLAAQTGDPELMGLLTQMQNMLQNEQQTMAQLGEPAQAMFGNVNQVLNQYQEQVQAGLEDPPMFRWRYAQDAEWEPAGNGQQNGQDQGQEPGTNGQNGPGYGPGDGTCTGDCDPVGDQNQFGQDQDKGQNGNGPMEPADNGQNGPGSGACTGDCDPVGDEHHYGQDPDNAGQNGPANGPGDGTGVCTNDCEPVGDQNQHGQDADNAGQNGDGVCENDCTPSGDGPHPNSGHNNGNGNGGGG
ncbi:MAG: hypothetical protein IPM53_04635 [Anaerolineaceae bacterium]|nr:hypothetical protein [Anaerolineaceae bacterium]